MAREFVDFTEEKDQAPASQPIQREPSTLAGNVMALASPVADAGIKGFMGIPDLAGMLANVIGNRLSGQDVSYRDRMGGKTAGEWIADSINPKNETYDNLMAKASPLARSTGKGLGAAEEVVANPVSKLMKTATLAKLAAANVIADQVPRAIISSETPEGQESQDTWADRAKLATNVGAATPDLLRLAAAIGKYGGRAVAAVPGVKSLGNMLWNQGPVGFAKELVKRKITGGDQALMDLVNKAPEQFAIDHDAALLAGTTNSPEAKEALARAIMRDTAPATGDSMLPAKLSQQAARESATLEQEASNATLGTTPSQLGTLSTKEQIGGALYDDLSAKYQTEHAIAKAPLEDAVLEARPLPEDKIKQLVEIQRAVRSSFRSVMGADFATKVELPQILKGIEHEAGDFAGRPPTMKDVRDIKQSLEALKGKADPTNRAAISNIESQVIDVADTDLKKAWDAYRVHSQKWDPSTVPGKVIQTQEGRFINPNDTRSGNLPQLAPADITDLLTSSSSHNSTVFENLAQHVGKEKAAAYFRNAIASDMEESLSAAGRNAPYGGSVKTPKYFENEDFLKKIFGESDFALVKDKISQMKGISKVRELADRTETGMPKVAAKAGGFESSGVGSKNIAGTGVFGYIRPGVIVRNTLANKMTKVNRELFNLQANRLGLPTAGAPLSGTPDMGMRGAWGPALTGIRDAIAANSPSTPQKSEDKEIPAMSGSPDDEPEVIDVREMMNRVNSKKKGNAMSGTLLGKDQDALLDSVKETESAGNPNAVSPKGAQGLYQFMPATARALKIDPHDPVQAREGAARLLRENEAIAKRAGYTDPKIAIAMYNWNPKDVLEALKKHGAKTWDDLPESGVPKETFKYVKKVYG